MLESKDEKPAWQRSQKGAVALLMKRELGDHTDTVQIDYDECIISYEDILAMWAIAVFNKVVGGMGCVSFR